MTEPGEDSIRQEEARFLREERETTRPFDPELMRLVDFINVVDGAEIGVTLHVKGCIVSGLLISIAHYYRLLVKEFTDLKRLSEESNRDIAASFAEFYRPTLDDVEEQLQQSRTREKPHPYPRHVHFRHAQTLVSGLEPFTQPLWRGRLTEVDGWSIGNFGSVPPLDE